MPPAHKTLERRNVFLVWSVDLCRNGFMELKR